MSKSGKTNSTSESAILKNDPMDQFLSACEKAYTQVNTIPLNVKNRNDKIDIIRKQNIPPGQIKSFKPFTNIVYAMFTQFNFTGSNLSNINFTGTHFNSFCKFNNVTATSTDFTGASFIYSYVIGANFEGANFTGSKICNLTVDDKTSFRGCCFNGAIFDRGDYSMCDFTGAIMFGITAPAGYPLAKLPTGKNKPITQVDEFINVVNDTLDNGEKYKGYLCNLRLSLQWLLDKEKNKNTTLTPDQSKTLQTQLTQIKERYPITTLSSQEQNLLKIKILRDNSWSLRQVLMTDNMPIPQELTYMIADKILIPELFSPDEIKTLKDRFSDKGTLPKKEVVMDKKTKKRTEAYIKPDNFLKDLLNGPINTKPKSR